MVEMRETSAGTLDPAQATELSLLVDLEARWENLRKTPSPDPEVVAATQDLKAKQKAYEAFRAKLVAYNKQYSPAHVPELLLNTPARLGIWCRKMRTFTSKWSTPRRSPARSTWWRKPTAGPTGWASA